MSALMANRRILVGGDREEAKRAVAVLAASRGRRLEIVGLVTDGTWTDGFGGHRVLGRVDDLPELAREHLIAEVILAPAPRTTAPFASLEPILHRLDEQGIVTRLLMNFLPQGLSAVSLDRVDGLPFLTFSMVPRQQRLLRVRRWVDVGLAVALLVVLSPLLAVIALGIKLTSPGPMLFRQTRCGLDGRPFTFLKFRSMFADAESLKPALARYNEMTGPAFKMTRDPRVTSIGRLLRRTSLDELPQLWNILRGDMSFVGPRPAVIEEVMQYEPWQRRRLSMKPGLTCLWQISGRSELGFDEWIRLDLEYIDNWSPWLDLKIALKTIPAVLLGKGAR